MCLMFFHSIKRLSEETLFLGAFTMRGVFPSLCIFLPRSNVAFPEMSFWSADVINNAAIKTPQLKVDLDVQSLDRKYDRTQYFDIYAALTVDFMGEFVFQK